MTDGETRLKISRAESVGSVWLPDLGAGFLGVRPIAATAHETVNAKPQTGICRRVFMPVIGAPERMASELYSRRAHRVTLLRWQPGNYSKTSPSPLGRGWPAAGVLSSRSGTGEGFFSRHRKLANLAHKPPRVFHHQPVRQSKHSNAETFQRGVLGAAPLQLARLSVNAAIQLNCKPKFEAVEVHHIASDGKLPVELVSRAAAAQKVPCDFFR
jgi:hypothetical protein